MNDPAWRVILRLLRSGDMSAGGIAQHFPTARSTLSGHFNLFKDAQLLVTERRGTMIIYGLNVSVYEEMVEAVMELMGAVAKRTPSGKGGEAMRTNLRAELPHLAVIAAMFLLAAATWSSAPDRIPVHWDLAGRVDRYGGKFEGLLLMPLLTLGIYLLFLVAPRFDPGRANYARFWRPYWIMRLAAVVVFALVYGFILLWTWGVQLDVWTVVPVLVGGLFVVLGSVMGKIKPNWFVGIRTPWTLSSELSWTKTHRLGGRLLVLMGIALFASGLVGSTWGLLFDLAIVTGCVLWLFVYSYLVWRADPEKNSPSGTSPDDRA